MALTDPIADALTQIRNALWAKKENVDIPNSKMIAAVVGILKETGYVENYKLMEDNKQGILRVYLKYKNSRPVIRNLLRISNPSRRVYAKAKDNTSVLKGLGIAIVSTSQGIMTDAQARQKNLGGEIICKVW
ncbi:MAG: 30S ribosomal protein S8 [Candidatus Omnitrophica bacterium]|nr:30S ribosomal protein S8 [Candidatus Omnitrophota bacterium]